MAHPRRNNRVADKRAIEVNAKRRKEARKAQPEPEVPLPLIQVEDYNPATKLTKTIWVTEPR